MLFNLVIVKGYRCPFIIAFLFIICFLKFQFIPSSEFSHSQWSKNTSRRKHGTTLSCALSSPLERCNPWPHVANRRISISQLLSLWRHSHYDVIRVSRAYGTGSPRSYYDVVRHSYYDIVSRLRRSQPPFSLWRHSHYDVSLPTCYGRTLRTDTIPRLIYKDYVSGCGWFYEMNILQYGVATRSRCDEIIGHRFIINLRLSKTVKEFWLSVSIALAQLCAKCSAILFRLRQKSTNMCQKLKNTSVNVA